MAQESSVQAAAAQIAQSEAIFQSIGDAAIATDQFGKVTRVNAVAVELLGFSEKELIGEWFPRKILAVTEDDIPVSLFDRPITRAFLTGRPISEKMYYRTNYGNTLPVSVNVSPIILGGKPVGAIEVFRDISLEEEVDRMKSEFISLASHQLRTPLSSIKTYSHMLLDGYMGDLTPAQKKSLRTIISASNRMNELISTLLNITRIESGRIAVTPKTLRVERIADEVIKELSLLAADRGVTVSLVAKNKQGYSIKTDTLILKEIITNLVSNAIKYTPADGTVVITVSQRNDKVLVAVKDSGWGIPVQSQDQVFTKFFRASNVVKRETAGTGLGLYLVKGLLGNIGGKIWFESAEGEGTTFFFTLPKSITPERPPKPSAESP
jgi:PAS domain S-box-containing protein